MKNRPISLLAFFLALAVLGCGKDGPPPSQPPVEKFSVRVVLSEPRISAGTQTTAKAQVVHEDGRVVDLDASTSQQWTSSEPQVVSVEPQADGTAKLTGHKVGSALISVTTQGASGQASLEVTAARITSLRVSPDSASVVVGGTQQFTVQGRYTDGTTADVTNSATWTTSNNTLATVSVTGLGTAVAAGGPVTVTATLEGVHGTAQLTITAPPPVLTSIHVSPATASVISGATQQFTAQGSFSDGTTADVTSSATWTTSDSLVATVSGTGLGTGLAAGGPLTITATQGGVSGTAQLSVTGWMSAGALVTSRDQHTATRLESGKVLVAGGRNGSAPLTSAELYDPATNSWSPAKAMTNGRFAHAAVLTTHGYVLVAGGFGALTRAELYDPASDTWYFAGIMRGSRSGHTMTELPSSEVLVVGGTDGTKALATVELFDPLTSIWFESPSMGTARFNHTATLLASGKVLVTGGTLGSESLSSAEVYDPTAKTWTPAAPMATRRSFHTATRLSSGKVLVSGGQAPTEAAVSELYDPATNTWTSAGAVGEARSFHTATLLSSGQVLVVGGKGGSYSRTTELYDSAPASPSWSPNAPMAATRGAHTATPLTSGRVLVVGGEDGTRQLSTAEVYVP
ncbi:kelch repeat-containing protein [Myxococcus landrumensis]|uniref:Ig-like domain-containing protein n=1 Tax=Myxococcus landrumensis TaxID=2813577 RepID=A0ABX7NFF7_9BACT|nr:kelch repeat-containing protein [Myxococcus landrumus]QSQ17143.1 Ig-like domain-containing protein [Myxococcus landrumus]